MLMGFFTFFRVLLDKKTMPQWPPVKLTCLRLKKLPHWPGQVAELTEAIQNSEQILEKNQTKNRLKAISWEMDGTWGNTYPQAELFRSVHYKLWFIGIVYVIVVHWQSICTRDIDMANRIRFICWLVTTTWYFLRVEISTPNQKKQLLCFEWSPPWHFKTACWHHFCLKLLSRDFCPTNYPNHLFHLAGHCACQSVKQDINMSVGHVK